MIARWMSKLVRSLGALRPGRRAEAAEIARLLDGLANRRDAALRVYVAAPFSLRAEVRAIHAQLRLLGMEPTSRWADAPGDGLEILTEIAEAGRVIEKHVALLAQNDADLARANAVLVLARQGLGGEMFCEVARALAAGKPVFWTGDRLILSAFHPNVGRYASIDRALTALGYLRSPT